MASRRDELNAYSFARKRTNAAFLKPLPNGSIESAPRPLKAVLPSVLVGVLILVGFGACGVLKPVAPKGWDEVGQNVIVGDESTTRYVVLETTNSAGKKEKLLHPVLNLASAKLLLDPDKYKVVNVKESELDGKIPHGPAVGIPYAPDRLPSKEDAGKPKVWAVCDRPGSGTNSKAQQAVFVLGGKDKERVEGKGKLGLNEALYVRDPEGVRWLVDSNGMAFRFANKDGKPAGPGRPEDSTSINLRRIIFGDKEPQDVSEEWMNTLIKSPVPITMPVVPGAGGESHGDNLPPNHRTIGSVFQVASTGQRYVVTDQGVQLVSDFVSQLLMQGQNANEVDPSGGELKLESVAASSFQPMDVEGRPVTFMSTYGSTDIPMPWPTEIVSMANNFSEGSQTGGLTTPTDNGVSCSVYKGTSTKYPGAEKLGYPNGVPNMSTWVGKDYPADIAPGATSYVTPGSGLLYQQVRTPAEKTGSLFLVTDTGLRYSVPVNNDSEDKAGKADDEVNKAALRLGYKGVHAPPILKAWSELLSAGPSLDVQSAKKPQTS